MKKFILAMLLGWSLHMLYFDFILIKQHQNLDACDLDTPRDKDGSLPCVDEAQRTYTKYYGKYFGIYSLIKWDKIITGGWRPE
jgi:hypothetical protein